MSTTINFGIDLGTTNSSIAVCRDGAVRVFQNNELMNVTPSVVYIGRTGRTLVGKKAYDTWIADPENTQAEFKRWIGFSDRLTFAASGRSMSAEELSAEVLKSLRADAMRQTQEQITEAVITVPAAFGSLQCEATGRAAKLAGFDHAPLLQEPVAAAIAYGAGPSSRDQRWMVFDLGGGTLDIAIVSTRNGRLAVLEHQGDNRLGGKDIDRVIAEEIFLAPLAQTFSLPDKNAEAPAFNRLLRKLVRQAEQAKIALSTAPQVDVEFFDLGDDRDGKPIELFLTLARAEVETRIAPLIERCLNLVERAIQGARLNRSEIDRVLLVGGPTQMPILRAALQSGIGAKLDHSLDPMTVVSHGAAFYASTLASENAAPAPIAPPATTGVTIELSHERASGSSLSPVAGKLKRGAAVEEIKIDADGGFWTSGWVELAGDRFALDVMLNDRKPVTTFSLLARDRKGREIPVQPASFSVAYMLPMSAPPLPHTIAIELMDHHGRISYDPIFKRHSPLPAEARRSYKAERTLRPSEIDSYLPIKFWEIEVSEDAQERWWAGSIKLRADRIKRPIVEGSDIELSIKIDPSRKMTVEVFVPLLNESFTDGVYIPDPPSARSQLQQQLDMCFERIEQVQKQVYAEDRDDLLNRVNQLQLRLEQIAEQVGEESGNPNADPDASLAPTEALRKIRIQLSQMEEQLETGTDSELARTVRGDARWTEQVVVADGSESDRQEVARLRAQLEKYAQADDPRGLKWVQEQLRLIRGPILHNNQSHWDNILNYLRSPGRKFLNQEEAGKLLDNAQAAQERGSLPEMRDALNKAWSLQPPDKAQIAKEQVAQSGLRGT